MIIGHHTSKPSKWRGVKTLFSHRVPDDIAVRLFIESLQRKQRPHLATIDLIHHAVFCPTGGGKSQGFGLPFLETCDESALVFDPKGELYKLTGATRRAMGHEVRILDPYHVVTDKPDTHNPMDFIDPKHLIADCRELGNALVKRDPNDQQPHWAESAEILIVGMCIGAMIFAAKPENRNLQRVRDMTANKDALLAGTAELCKHKHRIISRIGHGMRNYQDKELNGVLTTMNRNLCFMDEPEIAASVTASSYKPGKLRDGKMSIYAVVPLERLETQINYMRLILGSHMRACVKEGYEKKHPVHFLIDEAGALGPMKQINAALDQYRANMVRLKLFYQSIGQLKSCYPQDDGQTMLSNTSQTFMGTLDPATATHISDRLGSGTIVIRSGGTSGGGSQQHSDSSQGHSSSTSTSWNQTDNWQAHERKLLRPEEVTTLHPRWAITFLPGTRPILTWTCRHFEGDYKPRRLSRWRVGFDAACVFLCAAFLAAIATGVLYYHGR